MTTNKHKQSLLPVLVHIEEHLDEPLPLEQLAAVAGFSPHHFHRVFQHVTGEAPKEYLRRLRLERAVYRLKVSPDNVLQIALDAGFKTHETFTRAFLRQFDIHPSQFRNVLKEYRACADETMTEHAYEAFTPETPLTLRFNMQKEALRVEHIPAQHLIFIRYKGYENLLSDSQSFLDLWTPLFEFAEQHGLEHSHDKLIGITHDDPYVSSEANIRFDACLPVSGPIAASYPIGYRQLQPGLCVARRHTGGMEEIAKTFAHIGVEWLPDSQHCLRAAPPFEIHAYRQVNGRLERVHTDAYVPLEPIKTKAKRKP
ncbi:MAG: AraC family transcriptional regulator [Anaerolineales bacterium]|nr:MAG: AraC family transcriptional regulator [Anaerolineales bacterium]